MVTATTKRLSFALPLDFLVCRAVALNEKGSVAIACTLRFLRFSGLLALSLLMLGELGGMSLLLTLRGRDASGTAAAKAGATPIRNP